MQVSLQHGKPIIITNRDILLKNIGAISSAPVLERACCMVAKHDQHPAK